MLNKEGEVVSLSKAHILLTKWLSLPESPSMARLSTVQDSSAKKSVAQNCTKYCGTTQYNIVHCGKEYNLSIERSKEYCLRITFVFKSEPKKF